MACSHPFFDIDDILDATLAALDFIGDLCIRVRLLRALKVAPKVLEKSHFLLQVLWIVC